MTSNKGTEQPNTECCMCGDLGFSDQLFQCRVCQFRSQHRYCSNLYPKDESLRTCNWCLSQNQGSPNSSNSSSTYRNYNRTTEDESNKNKKIRIINSSHQNIGVKKGLQKLINKKPKSPPEAGSSSPPSRSTSVTVSTRKRIITNGELEERLRRTRSEDIMNRSSGGHGGGGGGAAKPVFKNKVRRYKLLDEVSS
ncbi:uncharacterized protein LOC130734165 [Lotus japonicus]|uniref:PHD-type zinc finger plants domain-containing protein n=1 Tax=Lotus japonicus TaxID=34305 RepID=I3T191_LOTJA|nr:uncharacterized protein LOC130734165 [Lotus japonicus]AFK46283.1 unknown [Lotus japonicus]